MFVSKDEINQALNNIKGKDCGNIEKILENCLNNNEQIDLVDLGQFFITCNWSREDISDIIHNTAEQNNLDLGDEGSLIDKVIKDIGVDFIETALDEMVVEGIENIVYDYAYDTQIYYDDDGVGEED